MPNLMRRAVPWLMAYEMLRATKDHWDHLDPADRRDLTRLMRKSKGDPRRLTPGERDELRGIAGRLQLLRLGLAVGTAAVAGRRRRRR
jgi:hypothetical protein